MFFSTGVLDAAVSAALVTMPAALSTAAPARSTTAWVMSAAPVKTRLMPPPTAPTAF
jgi:hypothetical protein